MLTASRTVAGGIARVLSERVYVSIDPERAATFVAAA
jgi:hypothetical protein